MSLASRVTALATRIGQEVKTKAPHTNPTFSGTVATPNLRISGPTPAAGKVWTAEDGAGNGSWQYPAAPDIEIPYVVGESVKVVDGPFNGFNGTVEKILEEKKKIEVSVMIFGRKTPMELNFMQVEKIV